MSHAHKTTRFWKTYLIAFPAKSGARLALILSCIFIGTAVGEQIIPWFTVDTGSVTHTAGTIKLSGTAGQHDAGTLYASSLRLRGGFWVVPFSTNQRPTLLMAIPNFTNTAGAVFSFTIPTNSFADSDVSQTLTYAAVHLPSGVSFDPVSKTFFAEPAQPGYYPLTVVVTDSGYPRLQISHTFFLTILESTFHVRWFTVDGGGGASTTNALQLIGTIGQHDAGAGQAGSFQLRGGFWAVPMSTNLPPLLLAPIVNHTNKAGIDIAFTIPAESFGDPNGGQSLSYAAYNLPPGLSFNALSRTFSGGIVQTGTYPVTVVVTDDGFPRLQTSYTFFFTVLDSTLQIRWFTVDGGGGELITAAFRLRGTTGQPDAGFANEPALHLRGGFWAAAFLTSPPPASIFVTSLSDAGPGSLREALNTATAGAAISLQATGMIKLTSGDLPVDRPITIIGPGASLLTISGQNNWRIFNVNAGPSFISGITIANGDDSADFLVGAGIRNNANLFLSECVFATNISQAAGGAVFNRPAGVLVVDRCLFVGNRALGAFQGGGVGGAVANQGILRITNSTFSVNVAGFAAAAIRSTGDLIIESCTFTHNLASECLDCEGVPSIVAHLGVNGIVNNSIIGGNTNVLGAFRDLTGTMDGGDYNLIEYASGYLGVGTNDLFGASPQLAPLADNGGPTRTHLPLPGSPVIDAGNPAILLPQDQRGMIRPQNARADIGAVETEPALIPPMLSITGDGLGNVTISWLPSTPGFVLQTNFSLNATTWGDASSGSSNPVVLPALSPATYYRLFKR